ncbi:hypothetical protein N1851_029237 [Merluccius polli]|uniref:DDE Tnp4 domain-containing protein n=1 Tax=Merluccius polli TaxID=89951 RepID=A0AA47M7A0_MERPO|nr:hypothetical protein N1851_029237 [Merluccius polli]
MKRMNDMRSYGHPESISDHVIGVSQVDIEGISSKLQAICDHRGKYINVCSAFPGSVHDARVLKNSPVYTQKLYPPEGRCIL